MLFIDFLTQVLPSLNKQELSNRNHAIMGDFNYSNTEWNNLHATHDCSRFLSLIMDIFFLCQHANFPTRKYNILDLFLTSDPNMVDKYVYVDLAAVIIVLF